MSWYPPSACASPRRLHRAASVRLRPRGWLRAAGSDARRPRRGPVSSDRRSIGPHSRWSPTSFGIDRCRRVTVRAGHGASSGRAGSVAARRRTGRRTREGEPRSGRGVGPRAPRRPDGRVGAAGVRRLHRVIDAVESAGGARRPRAVGRRVRSGASRRRRGGGSARELAAEDVTVLAGPVLATGRRELLTVLREQAVSRTRHRFGHLQRQPDAVSRQSLSSLSSARCATSAMAPLTPGCLRVFLEVGVDDAQPDTRRPR